MKPVVSPARLEGTIRVPGDKSISHRAVMLNGIAEGQGRISNFLAGADCLATVACMKALGVGVQGTEPLTVSGVGLHGLREPQDVLNAENSGTTMRLLTGLLAAQSFFTVMTGDESLRRRPMDRIIQPLRLMGAEVRGRQEDRRPPLAIMGRRLKSICYTLPVASAQLKSALLLAGLFADGKTTIVEPVPTRDHTERMLTAMGARVCSHAAEEGGNLVTVEPATALSALDLEVPGDLSSAAFWLVAAAVHPEAHLILECVGVNPTRTGILDILESMGARLNVLNRRMEGGEPVADISVESSALTGVEVAGDLISRAIDDIPVLAVAAAVASGTTVIRDASELRVKESDRITALATELGRLGAKTEELPDGLVIHGGTKLDGASCRAYGDHRLAMALAVAGLVARGETTIDDDDAVQVSYPRFWRDLDRVSKGVGSGG